MSNFIENTSTRNTSTVSSYQTTADHSRDTSQGFVKQEMGGSLSYQMGTPEQGLSEQLGGMKLSEELRLNGKMRVGADLSEFENIGHQAYTPSSEESLGYRAVSATGRQLTHSSEIKDDSVLTIGGVASTAEHLLKAGIISKDSNGNYVVPEQYQDSSLKKISLR